MKKFITMLAVITALLAVSAIGVSAAAGYIDDFSEPPVDGKVENYDNWQHYGAAYKEKATWLEDGMVKLERIDGDAGCIWDILLGVNNPEFFVMFDMKMETNANAKYVSGNFYNGKNSTVLSGFATIESDVWYEILIISNLADDGKYYYSMFVKAEGTEEWVKKTGPTEINGDSTLSPRIRINWNSKDYIGMAMYIDNIETHEGLYWESLTLTDNFGTEIAVGDAISDDASALTVSGVLYNAQTLDANMMSNPTDLASVPIVIVYDVNGLMLDCEILEYGIKYFENTFETTVNLGDYDKSEIASVKFYLWDSMENMLNIMEPVEMK